MKGNKVFIQPQVSQIYKINCLQKTNEKEGIAYKQKYIYFLKSSFIIDKRSKVKLNKLTSLTHSSFVRKM